jgi:hypothetical protein
LSMERKAICFFHPFVKKKVTKLFIHSYEGLYAFSSIYKKVMKWFRVYEVTSKQKVMSGNQPKNTGYQI